MKPGMIFSFSYCGGNYNLSLGVLLSSQECLELNDKFNKNVFFLVRNLEKNNRLSPINRQKIIAHI